MAKFTFVPYSVKVRKKREDKYLKLGISESNDTSVVQNSEAIDFAKIFSGFLDSLKHNSEGPNNESQAQENLSQNEDGEDSATESEEDRDLEGEKEESIIVAESFGVDEETQDVRGIFLAGDAEEGSEAFNPISGERLYKIAKGLALARPFYFRMKLSHLSDKGILILQTFRKYGIKDILEKELVEYIRDKYDDLIIEINPYVPKSIIEYYLGQRVFEVQLVKFGFPAEITERNADSIPEEESETISQGQARQADDELEEEKPAGKSIMVLKATKKNGFPQRWIEKLKGNIRNLEYGSGGEIRNLVEIKNFEYDNVKIKVKIGKNVRTINLAKKERVRYNEELDKDKRLVIDESTGHPEFQSIDLLGKDFVQGCADEVWGGQLNAQASEKT